MANASAAGRTVAIGAAGWFVIAALAGASGALLAARPPIPQVLIAVLAAALLVLFWTPTAFREWARAVDLRALVAIHLTRFVGFYFLWLYGRGELPYAFAVPGGIGDIAVAIGAAAICALARPAAGVGLGWILAWNIFGLVDIAMVVATATRLGLADPASIRALLHLPLSLLPTFLVPIIVATHVIIFARLREAR